jgi:hypothetical protein
MQETNCLIETMDEISAPDVLDSSLQHPFVFDELEEGEQLPEMAHSPPLTHP